MDAVPSRSSFAARTIFRPAIELMNRLTYTRKFGLLGLMSLVAMAIVTVTLYISLQAVLDSSQLELDGLNHIPPISRVTRLLEQHRGRSVVVQRGNSSFEPARATLQDAVTLSLHELEYTLPPAIAVNPRLKIVNDGWNRLLKERENWDADRDYEEHTRLINQMLLFTVQVADAYALTLDPDIDTYYLIDSSIIKLPFALEDLAQIRALGTGILTARSVSAEEKIRIRALLTQLERSVGWFSDNMDRTARYNPSIQSELESVSTQVAAGVNIIVTQVRSEIINEQFNTSPSAFFNLATLEIDKLYRLTGETLMQRTRLLLEQRIDRARNKLYLSTGASFALFLIVSYFTAGIYLAIAATMRALGSSAQSIAKGNLHERVTIETHDELGQIGHSFNHMASGFSELLVAQKRNERRLHVMFDTALDAVIQMNEEGLIIDWNRQAEAVFGWPRAEALGKPLAELIIPQQFRERHQRGLLAYVKAGQPGPMLNSRNETTALHRDGREFPIELAVAANHVEGKIEFNAFLRDISSRVQADEALKLSALVYQNSSEAMMVTDPSGVILTVNGAFTQITGYEANEVLGKTPRLLRSGKHDSAFFEIMWTTLAKTGAWKGEIWNRRKNGDLYAEELTINTIFNEDGSPRRRVAMFSDITERKRSEEQIWKQANFDALTGLPNRSMFHHRLSQDIRKCQRSSSQLALMFLDLDRFKEINDTLGHEMGDILLKESARRLLGCVREIDTVARLGGDEFTIILSELSSVERLDQIARTILERLSKPFQLGSETAYISCSIGVTLYPNDGNDADELVRNADQAMYSAKYQGKNCYNYFTQTMQESAQKRMRLSGDLHQAIAEQQFFLCYQPIVELARGRIHKAEALVRWNHPTRGVVSPAEFVPLAEETRLIGQIDDWVFREASRQTAKWREQLLNSFQISINSSPAQLRSQSDSDRYWLSHLDALGLPGDAIVVEITEGQLMDTSNDQVMNRLLRFRDAGIQVAVDDFGTGYSSLAYLRRFDIDYLKIDQSFTQGLGKEEDTLAVVEAIVVMAHKLGLKVIAEGIETEQQRSLLQGMGCDYGQGYLFARPVPAGQFEELLKKSIADAKPKLVG